jgi:hypothetical protein
MSMAAVPDGRLSPLSARPLPFRGASKRVGRQLNRTAVPAGCSVPLSFAAEHRRQEPHLCVEGIEETSSRSKNTWATISRRGAGERFCAIAGNPIVHDSRS